MSAGHPTHKSSNNNNNSKTKGNLPLYKASRYFYVTLDLAPCELATLTLTILIDKETGACFERVKNCVFSDIKVEERDITVTPTYGQGQLLIQSTAISSLNKVRLRFKLPEMSKRKAVGGISNTELPIYCFFLEKGKGNLFRPYVFGVINRGKPEGIQRRYAKIINTRYGWILFADQILCNSLIELGGDLCSNQLDHSQSLLNTLDETQLEPYDSQVCNHLCRLITQNYGRLSVNQQADVAHIETELSSNEEIQLTEEQIFVEFLHFAGESDGNHTQGFLFFEQDFHNRKDDSSYT